MENIRKTQRAMLGISLKDRKTNKDIRNRTKVKDAVEQAAKLKWKWAGDNERLKDGRWNKEIGNWRPYKAKRLRGRPQMRWSDNIKKTAGPM
ncbi:unnamed protein product, partial [Diabrotica balteata]